MVSVNREIAEEFFLICMSNYFEARSRLPLLSLSHFKGKLPYNKV